MAESNEVMKSITGAYSKMSDCFTTIEIDHHEIHEGEAFSLSVNTTSVASSSAIQLQINSPASFYIHLKDIALTCIDTLGRFSILEATTMSTFATGSAAVASWNKNRTSTEVAKTLFFSDPTLVNSTNSSMINILETALLGSTGSQAGPKGGEAIVRGNEWILKQNTTYILQLKNIGATIGQLGFTLFWYKHEST